MDEDVASIHSFAYVIAIGRSAGFKRNAALASGTLLAILGFGVLIDTVRRALGGEAPLGWIMIASGAASLVVNAYVLRLLSRFRKRRSSFAGFVDLHAR